MLNVYLLRHGQTPYNADGNRYCGRTDIGLTDMGIEQATTVSNLLAGKPIEAVYSSPLYRAFKTAELAWPGKMVRIDDRLIEVDFGAWEGKTKVEFFEEDPASWLTWMDNPLLARAGRTGESGKEVIERLDAFYNEMLNKYANETIMVVGHNGTNRLYMAYKLGMELKHYRRIFQENSSITMFALDDQGEFSLLKLNSRK